MLSGGSYKDENIVSRSFRFIAPRLDSPERVLQYVDYDLETSFFSTAVGDNRYVNPLPGFGYNTDPNPELAKTGRNTSKQYIPMGRYYKRIYDDNATLLTITAGAPEFSGVLQFLTNSFDYAASLTTNKGRTPSLGFYLAATVSAIAFYPLQLIGTGLNFISFLHDSPRNQWYYVKPATGQYLAAAQGIFNDLLVGAGYILPTLTDRSLLPSHKGEPETYQRGGAKEMQGRLNMFYEGDSGKAKAAANAYTNILYPDAVNPDGTIDIGKLITRGVRKYRHFLGSLKDLDNGATEVTTKQHQEDMRDILEKLVSNDGFRKGTGLPASDLTTSDYLKQELGTVGKYRGTEEISSPELASAYYDPVTQAEIRPSGPLYTANQTSTINSSINKSSTSNDGVSAAESSSTQTIKLKETTEAQNNVNVNPEDTTGWFNTVGNLIFDSFYGGFDAVTLRVEGGGGPTSDSFSNQTQQSELAGMFNGTVSAVNNFRFNIQGGATGFAPLDSVLEKVTDTLRGVAQGAAFGGPILAALGNSRVIIPEHWADSTTNLHTETFQIKCNALYATSYSIATQIYLPLALILPFVLPVCTGGSTYTTPFMCKVFSQGKTIIKTGIVKNASITFGTGELGWTRDRKPLNMTISLEFADLDPIVSAPVTRIKNPLEVFDINSTSGKYLGNIGKYNDYVARVTGRDYLDTVMVYNRLNRSLTSFTTDFKEIFSPSNVAGMFNDSIVSDAVGLFFNRPLNR